MGTNYYAIASACPNPCAHCEQQAEWHIGKSLFMFEAHDESPWGRIEDWEDWKRILPTVKIRDEYGTEHEAAGFIARVEATDPANRRRQYDWIVKHGLKHGIRQEDDYLDSHGFSWTRSEFT